MPADEIPVELLTETLVEVVRKELPPLLRSKRNWKFVLNGSAGGDVRTAIEIHSEVVRRYQTVSEHE